MGPAFLHVLTKSGLAKDLLESSDNLFVTLDDGVRFANNGEPEVACQGWHRDGMSGTAHH